MEDILGWIVDNKKWLFSGAGVVFFSWIVRMIFKGKQTTLSQKIRSGNNSTNIQAGRDIKIKSESKRNDAEEK